MHIEGTYDLWDAETSQVALDIFAHYQYREPDEVRREIWELVNEMICHAVITFLSGKKLEISAGHKVPSASLGGRDTNERISPKDEDIGRWFFYNSIYALHPQLETSVRLRHPIIGIGAPAGIMLDRTAQALHTELVLPKNHDVANAVGAIAGSVMVVEELLVYPRFNEVGLDVLGFYVHPERSEGSRFRKFCSCLP